MAATSRALNNAVGGSVSRLKSAGGGVPRKRRLLFSTVAAWIAGANLTGGATAGAGTSIASAIATTAAQDARSHFVVAVR